MEPAKFGVCLYCGQTVGLDCQVDTQEEADWIAAENCGCPQALLARQTRLGQERVARLFGPKAEELGFEPVEDSEVIGFLNEAVRNIAEHRLLSVTAHIRNFGTAKVCLTAKGRIKVTRSLSRAFQLET